jgi:GAF domain-containing protein
MPDSREGELSAASARLRNLLTNPLELFLDRVVHLAADVVDPPAWVGLTMQDHQPFTVISSDTLAARVDEIQYGHDQGPCLDALRQGIVVQVDDLTHDQRWDGYTTDALARGVMSTLSLPLIIDGQTVASLNIYSSQPAAFDGPPRRHAEALASQCAAALALMLSHTDQTTKSSNARRLAQLRREVIEIQQRVAATRQRTKERITHSRARIAETRRALRSSGQRIGRDPGE